MILNVICLRNGTDNKTKKITEVFVVVFSLRSPIPNPQQILSFLITVFVVVVSLIT